MSCNFPSVLTWCFFLVAWTLLATHYAHMKSPWQYREVASWSSPVKPFYDASFKL